MGRGESLLTACGKKQERRRGKRCKFFYEFSFHGETSYVFYII